LWIAYIDLKAAFDSLDRAALWTVDWTATEDSGLAERTVH